MIAKKNILFISNLFPTPLYPGKATFNKQQIAALSKYCNVDVVSPISWTEKFNGRFCPDVDKLGQLTVYYPCYYYIPKVFRKYYGLFFYKSIESTINTLFQRKKYDVIYASWLYPDGWAAAQYAKKYKIPFYVKVHGTDVNILKKETAVTSKSLEVIDIAHMTFCVSRALKARLSELGASEEKLKVVYNGIDTSIFYPVPMISARLLLGEPVDKKIILFVGNIIKTKGVLELAHAFVKLSKTDGYKNAHLVIVGDGSDIGKMKEVFNHNKIQSAVSFLGRLPLANVSQWMNSADLLCLPSYTEGVPNVILEALACDTKVVATSVGGIPEIANLDDRLILIEPKNTEQLHQVLIETLKGDRSVDSNTIQLRTWDENAVFVLKIMNLLD